MSYALLRPLLFSLSAERAHELTIAAMRVASAVAPLRGLLSLLYARTPDPRLAQDVFGMRFSTPLGLAAGLDKNGVAIDAFAALGFSHVEIGTLTAHAQPGNPKPRLFRLKADHAVINRMGFNNQGAESVGARLASRKVGPAPRGCHLGINLGKSKVTPLERALDDYSASVRALAPAADYVVVNVSSPNTPGLRDLQSESALRPLLEGVRAVLDETCPPSPARKPLLLKIAPDLADAGIDAAVDVALGAGCDGLITTNTTIGREGLRAEAAHVASLGAGGLSGAPLRARSTAVLARVARRIDGRVPIIGVGGVDSAESAWEKLSHGASLVQIYTGLIYEGPALVARIAAGLAARLDDVSAKSVTDIVGRAL